MGTTILHSWAVSQPEIRSLWEQGLPAMNDDTGFLIHRGAFIASKLCSYRGRVTGATRGPRPATPPPAPPLPASDAHE
ncbi:hypothetical protein DKY63_01630 [Pseudomonas putida]|uniref:Uncharacterized protein n=1 Tax=Pseudomonas putida TaxID=303 RepID=A0A2Z4RCG3_PSEPU|nr:hypothetical protein DKY63_01630 [Pseudomonas putida]